VLVGPAGWFARPWRATCSGVPTVLTSTATRGGTAALHATVRLTPRLEASRIADGETRPHDCGCTSVKGTATRRLSTDDVVDLRPAVEATVRTERVSEQDVEDAVQETLTRLFEVRGRLEPVTSAGYAIATARNLARSSRRAEGVAGRNLHRLYAPAVSRDPADEVLTDEEREATRRALSALPAPLREALLASTLPDRHASGPVPADLRTRAARARARARLEYVLAFRKVTLPSAKCRSVLLAVSARDGRRQASGDAGRHLLDCEVCPPLVPPLLERRRGLAALVPLPLVLLVLRWPRTSAIGAAVTSTGVTVAIAVAVAGSGHAAPPPPAAQVGTVVGTVQFASGSARLSADGTLVVADAAVTILRRHAHTVVVTGYTDSSTGAEANASLAGARAASVAAALRRELGPAYRVAVVAAGATDPVATNATVAGRAENRRAAISAR
jgi:outer membrane protein OmpA-like peptidoglycan-associated protein